MLSYISNSIVPGKYLSIDDLDLNPRPGKEYWKNGQREWREEFIKEASSVCKGSSDSFLQFLYFCKYEATGYEGSYYKIQGFKNIGTLKKPRQVFWLFYRGKGRGIARWKKESFIHRASREAIGCKELQV